MLKIIFYTYPQNTNVEKILGIEIEGDIEEYIEKNVRGVSLESTDYLHDLEEYLVLYFKTSNELRDSNEIYNLLSKRISDDIPIGVNICLINFKNEIKLLRCINPEVIRETDFMIGSLN
ncbi:hypothetical protein [Fusobacterium sp. PH5-44]|uniref:hypothetical protein n=1 Tax=unclassified Fusobacterium TaxID=2648384 RepID=UPI003D22855D